MGDIGDFPKFGLLRTLAGIAPQAKPTLTLGVVWYLPDRRTIEKTDPGHGQNVGYLDQRQVYRDCDPALFDGLRDIVAHDRSLAAVEASGILGDKTAFWSEPIPPTARKGWLERALSITASAEIILLDPDVGLATASMEQKRQPSTKHVLRNEIRAFMRLSRKQTVVVYQHYPRTPSSRQAQVDAWQAALRIRSLAPPPRILDSGNREFVILPADHHAAIINDRLATLLASRWAGQIRLGSH